MVPVVQNAKLEAASLQSCQMCWKFVQVASGQQLDPTDAATLGGTG